MGFVNVWQVSLRCGKAGKVSYVLFRSGMLGRGMAGEASSVGLWCVPLGQSFVVVRQASWGLVG